MARIGLALTGGLAPGEIVECVQLAEELGYESVWMEEGHGGEVCDLDGLRPRHDADSAGHGH